MQSAARSEKESPLSVVFYEIRMLNYAAGYLEDEILSKRDHVANAWQEVYLLHYRNLVEFFGERKSRTRRPDESIDDKADDIRYLKPLTWAEQNLPKDELMPAVVLARPLDDCFEPISRYLQHCTDWRYEIPKAWDYPAMHANYAREDDGSASRNVYGHVATQHRRAL